MGNIRPRYIDNELISFEAFAGKTNGRKIRKRFSVHTWGGEAKARGAAEKWVKQKSQQLNSQRAYGALLDERTLGQVSEALELLSPLGVSLIDAVRAYVRGPAAEEPTLEPWHYAQAWTEFLRHRKNKGVSADYLKRLEFERGVFKEEFGDYSLDDITVDLIEDWLDEREGKSGADSLSPVTRTNWRRDLSMVWRFAIERGRATTNPAALLPVALNRDSEIHILPVEDAETLFANLRKKAEPAAREAITFAALACFCGLRSIEIYRLDRSNIRLEEGIIEVPARVSKTRARRMVKIAKNMLHLCGEFSVDEGPVISISPRSVRRFLVNCSPTSSLLPNVLRHSWFSYHLALHQDEKLTQLEGGHASPNVLYRHYRALVTKDEATRYFSIRP